MNRRSVTQRAAEVSRLVDLVWLRRNAEHASIRDLEIRGLDLLRGYDSVECHAVIYPYSRAITSDEAGLYPYQEYADDVEAGQRSAYAEIKSSANELFGLFLGFVIAAFFALFNPQDLVSVESIVSVFGAYALGKELWDDLDRLLIEITKSWRLTYREPPYRYRLEKYTTLTRYWRLAKRERYQREQLVPERMDFIRQSNSQTARMYFDARDLARVQNDVAHVLSIHIEPELTAEFERAGYLLGIKLSLNRRRCGIVRSLELFQSLNRGVPGCLDDEGGWVPGGAYFRRTWQFGRFKWYQQQGILEGHVLLCQG